MPQFLKNDKAEFVGILYMGIVAIVAIVVISIFGNALIPTAITSASNTTAIAGYSTWSTSSQSMFTTVPTFISMDYMFIYIIILLALVGAVSRAA